MSLGKPTSRKFPKKKIYKLRHTSESKTNDSKKRIKSTLLFTCAQLFKLCKFRLGSCSENQFIYSLSSTKALHEISKFKRPVLVLDLSYISVGPTRRGDDFWWNSKLYI